MKFETDREAETIIAWRFANDGANGDMVTGDADAGLGVRRAEVGTRGCEWEKVGSGINNQMTASQYTFVLRLQFMKLTSKSVSWLSRMSAVS